MPSDLMSAEFYKDPGAFFDAYGQTLEQNEVEHSLILSLIARALDKKITRLPFDAWFGVASSKNQPALIALQTPPHNLVLSRAYQSGAEDFLAGLAEDLGVFPDLGVAVRLHPAQLHIEERLHQIDDVLVLEVA